MRDEKSFAEFKVKIGEKFLQHPIVLRNRYTRWFSKGEMDLIELRHFTVQFSVFSNFFLVAQLKKMINSDTLESMRSAKEILANEIGVSFKDSSVEGGTFRFKAGHFEWLLNFGKHLGLSFQDLGKRKGGTSSTWFFCSQLDHFYGGEDQNISAGASFAIENWAAAGFWQELISGLAVFRDSQLPELPLGFFEWHNEIEGQHAHNTQDELKTLYFQPAFDEEKFLHGGLMILDALSEFWNGLERDRLCGRELLQKNVG